MAKTLPLVLPIARPRRRISAKTRVALGAVVVVILLFLWWIGVFGGNVRTVEKGRFYRSAQLSGSHLENVMRQYGIRSVINLRGASEKGFYRSEVEISQKLGAEHFDVSMSAYRLPRPKELAALFAALDKAPRPILIHCQQGADRSGMASTIYENAYEGFPLDRAEHDQLTWRYGHFGFVGTWRLDQFFDLYRKTGGGQDLRTWSRLTYPDVYSHLYTGRS